MRGLPIAYSDPSKADMARIFAAVLDGGASPRTAGNFVRRIELQCQRIGGMPRGGRDRSDLRPGLRSWPFERRAMIFYTIEDKRVLILRVFFHGQNYEAALRQP